MFRPNPPCPSAIMHWILYIYNIHKLYIMWIVVPQISVQFIFKPQRTNSEPLKYTLLNVITELHSVHCRYKLGFPANETFRKKMRNFVFFFTKNAKAMRILFLLKCKIQNKFARKNPAKTISLLAATIEFCPSMYVHPAFQLVKERIF